MILSLSWSPPTYKLVPLKRSSKNKKAQSDGAYGPDVLQVNIHFYLKACSCILLQYLSVSTPRRNGRPSDFWWPFCGFPLLPKSTDFTVFLGKDCDSAGGAEKGGSNIVWVHVHAFCEKTILARRNGVNIKTFAKSWIIRLLQQASAFFLMFPRYGHL